MAARKWLSSFTLLAVPGIAWAQPAQPQDTLVERVGSTGFIQVRAESFRALDARQQETLGARVSALWMPASRPWRTG